jgi:hypothetical protein
MWQFLLICPWFCGVGVLESGGVVGLSAHLLRACRGLSTRPHAADSSAAGEVGSNQSGRRRSRVKVHRGLVQDRTRRPDQATHDAGAWVMADWRVREARNEARFREQNEWIEATETSYGASGPLVRFVCERGDVACTQTSSWRCPSTSTCVPQRTASPWPPTKTPNQKSSSASTRASRSSTRSRVPHSQSSARGTHADARVVRLVVGIGGVEPGAGGQSRAHPRVYARAAAPTERWSSCSRTGADSVRARRNRAMLVSSVQSSQSTRLGPALMSRTLPWISISSSNSEAARVRGDSNARIRPG